ncbi:site-specific integrase [Pectinatus frisingensis]|uniref:site-specific integrase n=1 Tax=Pectinatus frisingensis TaxID=865 RepID=UPI0018C5D0DF|nr:site-specific integrase [Pectinatus frisingensis]
MQINEKMSLGDYMLNWYMLYKYQHHAETTRNVQLVYINVHIRPSRLGHIALSEIRTIDIQKFLNQLLINGNKSHLKNNKSTGKGLGEWAVKKIRALIISALKRAAKEHLINSNYAEDTEPIPIPITQHYIFSVKQQQLFFRDLEKTKYRYILMFKLYFITGARRSEIAGLTWENVLWEQNCINICNAVVLVNNKPFIKKIPKTRASIRTQPLPIPIMQELRQWKKLQLKEAKTYGLKWKNYKNQLVFVKNDGDIYNPNNLLQCLKKRLKKLGLPEKLTIHKIRHTVATNLFHNNVPISEVQSIGGWASPVVPLQIYSHSISKEKRKAINDLYKKTFKL